MFSPINSLTSLVFHTRIPFSSPAIVNQINPALRPKFHSTVLFADACRNKHLLFIDFSERVDPLKYFDAASGFLHAAIVEALLRFLFVFELF